MRPPTLPTTTRDPQRGQVLAIFAIALVAIIAMTGLVLDGGSTFVQRRDQQNVADAVAMAAAYDYLNTGSTISARATGQSVAEANGYKQGEGGVVVDISFGFGAEGLIATASVGKPHRNMFSGIVGMPNWNVSTTASARTGAPNAAIGAMPLIFNQDAFLDGGATEKGYGEPPSGNEDVPLGTGEFNWTVYCTAQGADDDGDGVPDNCNADSNTVRDLIDNSGTSTQVDLTDNIAPLNAGSHTTLFSSMASHVGEEFPVCIVDDDGKMVGWAMFHLSGSVGGSTKQIIGYFVTPVNDSGIYIAQGAGTGSSLFGAYEVKLVN